MENKNISNEIKRLVDNIEILKYQKQKHIDFLSGIYSIVHSKTTYKSKVSELMKEIDYMAEKYNLVLSKQKKRYYNLRSENRCVICGDKAKEKTNGQYYTYCQKHFERR